MQLRYICAYKFIDLPVTELYEIRDKLQETCIGFGFRGTILLAEEGINLTVSGEAEAVGQFTSWLSDDPRFADLDYKCCDIGFQPFRRMLVKVKKEIIAFGVPDVLPARKTAPYLSVEAFKQWLDEGRELTVLDTRNNYETALGVFDEAETLNIQTFREFPTALAARTFDADRPIVTYCTGGIRCEKASALMLSRGFRNVYQLEGGILRYFEMFGDTHYNGECFVFDRRVAIDGSLAETAAAQCFNCIHPVSVEEQREPSYQPPNSCPHCVDGKWKS